MKALTPLLAASMLALPAAILAEGPYPTPGDAPAYVDAQGKTVIQGEFAQAGPFSEGLAAVKDRKSSKWGFIDGKGAYAIAPAFEEAGSFREGLAKAMRGGKWGFIAPGGNWAIEPAWASEPGDFYEGRARVSDEGFGPFGFADRTGKLIVPMQFPGAGHFSEGLAPVSQGESGDVSFVGLEGALVPELADALQGEWGPLSDGYGFSEGFVSGSSKKTDKRVLVDKTGAEKSFDGLDVAGMLQHGLVPVRKEKAYGFADASGRLAVEPAFENIDGPSDRPAFQSGLACVKKGGKWGFIAPDGKWTIEPRFDQPGRFDGELALLRDSAGPFYVDKKGKVVWRAKAPAKP